MTKKKSIITRLLLALIVLTLISFCFLGSTFARYTSGTSGTATATVAKWEIGYTGGDDSAYDANTNTFTLSFEKLSPSEVPFTGDTRSNATTRVAAVTITSNSDVEAEVSLVIDSAAFTLKTGAAFDATYTQAKVTGLFSLKLYTNATATADEQAVDKVTIPAATTADGGTVTPGTVTIYAVLTWTTDDAGTYCGTASTYANNVANSAAADALDTWVGENVTSVAYNVTCTVVQSTKLPA